MDGMGCMLAPADERCTAVYLCTFFRILTRVLYHGTHACIHIPAAVELELAFQYLANESDHISAISPRGSMRRSSSPPGRHPTASSCCKAAAHRSSAVAARDGDHGCQRACDHRAGISKRDSRSAVGPGVVTCPTGLVTGMGDNSVRVSAGMLFGILEEEATETYVKGPTLWPPMCPFSIVPAQAVIKQKPLTPGQSSLLREAGVLAPLAYKDDTPVPSKPRGDKV